MGLLGKIASNPAAANLMLMGLGLLGSKRRSQADRYIGGISQGLLDQAEWRRGAKEREQMQQLRAEQIKQAQMQNQAPAMIETLIGRPGGESRDPVRGEPIYQSGSGFLYDQDPMKLAAGLATVPGQAQTGIDMMTGLMSPDPTKYQVTTIGAGDGLQQRAIVDLTNPNQKPIPIGEPYESTPSTVINMGDKAGFELSKKHVQRIAKAYDELDTYNATLPLLDAIEQDMQVFPTSAMAPAELLTREVGGVLGAGDPAILAAGERLKKNTSKLVSENMAFLKGAMSEGEREFTKEFSLGLSTSVAGNLAYIGFLRNVAERAAQKAPMMEKWFVDNDGSLIGFDEYWQKYINDNPVEIPEILLQEANIDEEIKKLKQDLKLD